jgi:3-hydroxymyristoyl/3-hydroxydecanoyl-(acyl carrier protein) dehydratase
VTDHEVPPEALACYRAALVRPLLNVPEGTPLIFAREFVLDYLPQRPPFLFLDGVQAIRDGILCATFDVDQTPELFAAHFPGVPRWPGVIQIEAMAEAAMMLYLSSRDERRSEVAAGILKEARFIREVVPGRIVQLLGAFFENGLWTTVVGQTLQGGQICSASIGSFV